MSRNVIQGQVYYNDKAFSEKECMMFIIFILLLCMTSSCGNVSAPWDQCDYNDEFTIACEIGLNHSEPCWGVACDPNGPLRYGGYIEECINDDWPHECTLTVGCRNAFRDVCEEHCQQLQAQIDDGKILNENEYATYDRYCKELLDF